MNKWEEPPKKIKRSKIKVKKKRKMTAEQKAAAAERLQKAREARGITGNSSLPENIRHLPDDHFVSPKKVKAWLKIWKEKLVGMKYWKDSKDREERIQYQIAENYVKNMQSYLTTGIWSDLWYGENREHKTVWEVVAPAYNKDGTMKRTQGYFYHDIGFYGVENEVGRTDAEQEQTNQNGRANS